MTPMEPNQTDPFPSDIIHISSPIIWGRDRQLLTTNAQQAGMNEVTDNTLDLAESQGSTEQGTDSTPDLQVATIPIYGMRQGSVNSPTTWRPSPSDVQTSSPGGNDRVPQASDAALTEHTMNADVNESSLTNTRSRVQIALGLAPDDRNTHESSTTMTGMGQGGAISPSNWRLYLNNLVENADIVARSAHQLTEETIRSNRIGLVRYVDDCAGPQNVGPAPEGNNDVENEPSVIEPRISTTNHATRRPQSTHEVTPAPLDPRYEITGPAERLQLDVTVGATA
jgi:hypothetical protein